MNVATLVYETFPNTLKINAYILTSYKKEPRMVLSKDSEAYYAKLNFNNIDILLIFFIELLQNKLKMRDEVDFC